MTPADGGAAGVLPERVVRKIAVSDRGCWEWQARLDACGYGRLNIAGRNAKAHREVFKMMGGVIPSGMVLDHLCRNRRCVNPSHLRAVSPYVNNMENSNSVTAKNAAKTHCKRGHPFTEQNTIRARNGRKCRECVRQAKVIYRKYNRSPAVAVAHGAVR